MNHHTRDWNKTSKQSAPATPGLTQCVATNRRDIGLCIRRIVAERAGIEVELVTEYASLSADLNYDSLDMVETAMEIEEALGICIADEAMEGMRFVRDAIVCATELVAADTSR